MTDFDVEVECSACGALFGVPRIRQGRTENCPVCRFPVQVPGERTEEVMWSPELDDGHEGIAVSGTVAERAARVQDVAPPRAPAAALSGKCLVCLRDDVKFDITKVSPIVDELDRLITLDTKMQLARGRGVLAEHVPTDLAEEMVARLRTVQVLAFAVDEALVPVVERELPMTRIYDVADDSLYVQTDVHGTVQGIPWPLVAGGFCTKLHVERGGPTDLRRKIHFVPLMTGTVPAVASRVVYKAAPRPREPDILCTLLMRGKSGNLYRFKLPLRQVRYTYLGARRKPSSILNFATFLTDVIQHCAHGFFPGSTRAVAAGQKMRVAKLRRQRDYDNYLQWVCCCVAAGWYEKRSK